MSDPETIPSGVHPEVTLLPWYASGTLHDAERDQVARHLESCPDCRRELNELSSMKRDLAAFYQSQPAPSPRLARSIMAQVAAERRVGSNRQPEAGSWLNGIDEWLRSLFLPRWVPTLAATLVLAQISLIIWISIRTPHTEEVITRSLGVPTAKIRVTFQPATTEKQIRSVLETVHGRIIDGPTTDGLYTMEFPVADEATARQKLETIRERTDVVRSADLYSP